MPTTPTAPPVPPTPPAPQKRKKPSPKYGIDGQEHKRYFRTIKYDVVAAKVGGSSPIARYCSTKSITFTQFHEQSGLSYSTVRDLFYGTTLPSLPQAAKIEAFTRGAIKVTDWYGTDIFRQSFERLEEDCEERKRKKHRTEEASPFASDSSEEEEER